MRRWRRWLRAALLVWQEEGLMGVARYTARRAYLHQGFLLYQRDLSAHEAVPLPPALTLVRLATPAERNALLHAREDFAAASYWEVIQPDAECYVGLDGYRIVSVHWLSSNEESNRLVELGPEDFVIGPCVTASTHRGRGVYPAMIRALCADRYRKGQRRAYMVVSVHNAASIRGIEKAGFHCIGRADLRRVAGLQRVVRQPITAAP
ncbi:MAG: GNAT family N-acetyltransferase [Deltaproteobacteria bacterium]|nr:GNAT family N-acetyltransferase [Deltaproteobacteria bacterium]